MKTILGLCLLFINISCIILVLIPKYLKHRYMQECKRDWNWWDWRWKNFK